MSPNAKKTIIVIGSFLAIGGVVAYLLWKRNKKKKEQEDQSKDLTKEEGGSGGSNLNVTPNVNTGGGTSGGGTSGGSTNPIGKVEEIKKFQDWLDAKGLKWVKATNSALTNGQKLNKGGGYGNYGSSTEKAWAVYGEEYRKATKPVVVGSGLKNGTLLYPRQNFANAFSFPSNEKRYVIGKILRNGGKPSAKFIQDSSAKGWIKVTAIIEDYTWNENTKAYGSALKECYVPASDYTTIAP